MISRSEIIKELKEASENVNGIYYTKFVELNFAEFIVDKIFDNIEKRNCTNCGYYLSDNGNYQILPCTSCSKFYTDKWEMKK